MAITTPVSYYKFEWNSNDSVWSNNGTDTSITYSSGNGKILQWAWFNGTSSFISIWTWLNTTMIWSSWSISFWGNSTTAAHQIAIACDNNTGARQFACWILNSKIYFERAGTWVIANTGTTVSGYYQVVFIYTGGTLYWYLNNSLITSVAMSALPTSANPIQIGRRQYTGSNLYYNGALDEIWFWSTNLSSGERSELYNSWNWISYPFNTNSNFFMFF